MKNTISILTVLLLLIAFEKSFSSSRELSNKDSLANGLTDQSNELSIGDFYSLEIGNTWEYSYYSNNPDETSEGTFVRKVIGDTLVKSSNKKYAIIKQTNGHTGKTSKLYHRIDNINNVIYYLDSSGNSEYEYARKPDSTLITFELFGIEFSSFISDRSYKDTDKRTFAKGVGMVKYDYWSFIWGSVYKENLISCIVQGNEYKITGLNTTTITNSFAIFPNPAESSLRIKLDGIYNSNIKIFNLNGNQVLASQGKEVIDISKLSSGIYILEVIDYNGNSMKSKMIKK